MSLCVYVFCLNLNVRDTKLKSQIPSTLQVGQRGSNQTRPKICWKLNVWKCHFMAETTELKWTDAVLRLITAAEAPGKHANCFVFSSKFSLITTEMLIYWTVWAIPWCCPSPRCWWFSWRWWRWRKRSHCTPRTCSRASGWTASSVAPPPPCPRPGAAVSSGSPACTPQWCGLSVTEQQTLKNAAFEVQIKEDFILSFKHHEFNFWQLWNYESRITEKECNAPQLWNFSANRQNFSVRPKLQHQFFFWVLVVFVKGLGVQQNCHTYQPLRRLRCVGGKCTQTLSSFWSPSGGFSACRSIWGKSCAVRTGSWTKHTNQFKPGVAHFPLLCKKKMARLCQASLFHFTFSAKEPWNGRTFCSGRVRLVACCHILEFHEHRVRFVKWGCLLPQWSALSFYLATLTPEESKTTELTLRTLPWGGRASPTWVWTGRAGPSPRRVAATSSGRRSSLSVHAKATTKIISVHKKCGGDAHSAHSLTPPHDSGLQPPGPKTYRKRECRICECGKAAVASCWERWPHCRVVSAVGYGTWEEAFGSWNIDRGRERPGWQGLKFTIAFPPELSTIKLANIQDNWSGYRHLAELCAILNGAFRSYPQFFASNCFAGTTGKNTWNTLWDTFRSQELKIQSGSYFENFRFVVNFVVVFRASHRLSYSLCRPGVHAPTENKQQQWNETRTWQREISCGMFQVAMWNPVVNARGTVCCNRPRTRFLPNFFIS